MASKRSLVPHELRPVNTAQSTIESNKLTQDLKKLERDKNISISQLSASQAQLQKSLRSMVTGGQRSSQESTNAQQTPSTMAASVLNVNTGASSRVRVAESQQRSVTSRVSIRTADPDVLAASSTKSFHGQIISGQAQRQRKLNSRGSLMSQSSLAGSSRTQATSVSAQRVMDGSVYNVPETGKVTGVEFTEEEVEQGVQEHRQPAQPAPDADAAPLPAGTDGTDTSQAEPGKEKQPQEGVTEASPAAAPEETGDPATAAGEDVAPVATPEATPETAPETAPAAIPEVTPEAATETTPGVTPEAAPGAPSEAAPAAGPDAAPSAAGEQLTSPAPSDQQAPPDGAAAPAADTGQPPAPEEQPPAGEASPPPSGEAPPPQPGEAPPPPAGEAPTPPKTGEEAPPGVDVSGPGAPAGNEQAAPEGSAPPAADSGGLQQPDTAAGGGLQDDPAVMAQRRKEAAAEAEVMGSVTPSQPRWSAAPRGSYVPSVAGTQSQIRQQMSKTSRTAANTPAQSSASPPPPLLPASISQQVYVRSVERAFATKCLRHSKFVTDLEMRDFVLKFLLVEQQNENFKRANEFVEQLVNNQVELG